MNTFVLLGLVVFSVCVWALEATPRTYGVWKQMKSQGAVPIERPYAGCAVLDKNLYVYGGRTGVTAWSHSVHKFNLETSTWSTTAIQPVDAASKLPPLSGHTLTRISDGEWLVFGGRSGLWTFSNNLYLIDLKKDTSQLLKTGPTMKPSPRWEHGAAFHDGVLYVIGGSNGKEAYNDIFSYDIKEEKWSVVNPSGVALPNIYGHSATIAHGKIYIIGGYLTENIFNPHLYVYDIETNTLSKISNSGLKPRAFHTSSLIGNYIYVVGGLQGNDNLVDKVQILHTLKNQIVDFAIGGKFPARKNHCAVVDDRGRSIIVFGGISARRWGTSTSRNDVIVLDTSSDVKLVSDAPLTQRLSEILIDINSENFSSSNFTEQKPIEQQLLSQLDKDRDEEFAELPQRISNCKEIELLYHEMVNSESNRRDIIGQSKMFIEEIKKISNSFVYLRDQLLKDAALGQDKLKKLNDAENQLIQSQQLHKQAKQDEILAREQKQQARKQLAILQASIVKAKAQISSAESKKASAEESLSIYNSWLKNSDQEFIQKKEEERQILDKLRQLSSQSGNITSNIEGLRTKILTLQKAIHDSESHLQTLRNLPLDQMRTLYATGDNALKQLINMFEYILKFVEQDGLSAPGNADLDQFNPDRIAEKIQNHIAHVNEKLTMEYTLLETLKRELSAMTQELDYVKHEDLKWKRKHEEIVKAITQINSLMTDSDKKRADLEFRVSEANELVLAYRIEVEKLEKNLKEAQLNIEKFNNDEELNVQKREKEVMRDAKLQKEIRQLRGELEDMDAELRRKYQEAVDIQRDLSEMRTSISVSKELFDQQSFSVNEAREKLLKKLNESNMCSRLEEEKIALEKENLELKRRISELEKKLSASTDA